MTYLVSNLYNVVIVGTSNNVVSIVPRQSNTSVSLKGDMSFNVTQAVLGSPFSLTLNLVDSVNLVFSNNTHFAPMFLDLSRLTGDSYIAIPYTDNTQTPVGNIEIYVNATMQINCRVRIIRGFGRLDMRITSNQSGGALDISLTPNSAFRFESDIFAPDTTKSYRLTLLRGINGDIMGTVLPSMVLRAIQNSFTTRSVGSGIVINWID